MSAVARDYAYQVKIDNSDDKPEPTISHNVLEGYQADVNKYLRKENGTMKERTIERETHYKYDENDKLTSMTVHETITNPSCEECGLDDDIDDAEMMTGEIEVKTEHGFADIAFGMVSIGLVVAAIGMVVTTITTALKNNKE